MAQPPVDPNVAVPPSVAAAARASEAAHAKAYNTPPAAPPPASPPPAQDPPLQPVADPQPQPVATPPLPPAQDPPLAPPADTPPPPTQDPPAPKTQAQVDWEARYRAMEGRYRQVTRTNGVMQEQMRELGNELVQTQQVLQQRGITAAPSATPSQQQRLVTEKDVETFGAEFLDTVQRAALDAASPILAQVQEKVNQVSQSLTRQQKHQVAQQLSAQVPNWRELNENERFKEWASLRDVYSGQVRGKLLNAAIRQGDASRAAAFFKGFLQEEQATGQLPPPAAAAPQQARTPAMPMEAIAAPGRAQPAPGTQPAQAPDKPIITHGQIKNFYDLVRKGHYVGRDADRAAHEAMIFAAQNEGRIR